MLLNACKDIGLAVNIGKTKYMEIGRNRGMRRRWEDNIRMDLEEIVSMRVIGLIRLRIGIIGNPS